MIAVLQKRYQELSGEPEDIPKLSWGMLATRRHAHTQASDQVLDCRASKPPVGFNGDHFMVALQEAKQRYHIDAEFRLELPRAGGLAPSRVHSGQHLVPETKLPIAQP